MPIRRWAALPGALALLMGVVAGPNPRAQAAPGSGTSTAATTVHALTPASRSTVYDQLHPLTGSAGTLVYQRAPSLADGINRPGGVARTNGYTTTLVARSASGHEVVLAAPPADADVALWSLAGSTLTVAALDGGESPTGLVHWWDTDTGAHGSVTLAADENYEAAAPGGVVVLHGSELLRRSIGGAETTLGVPPGAALASVVSDADGLVLTSVAGEIRYEAFAAPGTYRTLHSASTQPTICTGFSAVAAACYTSDEKQDFGWSPGPVRIVPLDGSAPTVPASGSIPCPGYPTIAGARLYVGSDCHPGVEYTATLGSTTVITTSTDVISPVSALGQAIGQQDGRELVALSPTGSGAVVVPARYSLVTADEYALTTGRIVYSDDQPDPAHPTALAGVHARDLTTDPAVLTVGAAHRIDPGTNAAELYPDLVAASGTTTVYATLDASADALTLSVTGPGGERSVAGVPSFARIELSGNRLVYAPATGADYVVLDTATWRQTSTPATKFVDAITVWGNYLVWADAHGGVYRHDLTTATTTTLAAPTSSSSVDAAYVYAYGDWVGWQLRISDQFTNVIRNARTLAAPIVLTDTLWSLSSAGALLVDTKNPQGEANTFQWNGSAGLLGTPTPVKLLGYDGIERTLLPSQSFVGGPQLSGRTLVWADEHGRLRAQQLPALSVPAPRSLGAALISAATITPGSTTPWLVQVPYSQQLQSCQITFTRAGVVERVLACAAIDRSRGVAAFQWNGTDGSGAPLPAGTYTFQITGRGVGGATLNGGGTNVPVAGTVGLT